MLESPNYSKPYVRVRVINNLKFNSPVLGEYIDKQFHMLMHGAAYF